MSSTCGFFYIMNFLIQNKFLFERKQNLEQKTLSQVIHPGVWSPTAAFSLLLICIEKIVKSF